jgi:hypothetical protein
VNTIETVQALASYLVGHVADLRRCAAALDKHGMDATALETRKAADEIDALLAQMQAAQSPAPAAPAPTSQWQDIATAPKDGTREMFVVKAFNVSNGFTGGKPYTSDPWCVWRESDGSFSRWPHHFQPTHWHPLSAAPEAK